MDDALVRAEVEVIALENSLQVGGWGEGETVTIPGGQGMSLPADTSSPSPPIIFRPGPVRGGVFAVLAADEKVEPVPEQELLAFEAGSPLVYSMPDVEHVDLRHFRAVAAQVADHDLRLVIVAGRLHDGGN